MLWEVKKKRKRKNSIEIFTWFILAGLLFRVLLKKSAQPNYHHHQVWFLFFSLFQQQKDQKEQRNGCCNKFWPANQPTDQKTLNKTDFLFKRIKRMRRMIKDVFFWPLKLFFVPILFSSVFFLIIIIIWTISTVVVIVCQKLVL